MARYRDIAADLRRRIDAGEFPPGSRLPGYADLTGEYATGRATISDALNVLQVEGRILVRKKAGITVVDTAAPPERLDFGLQVGRDELGYFFNQLAGLHWAPLSTPTTAWGPAAPDIAELLGINPGDPVLTRHRIVGPGTPAQIAISYLPEHLARGTVLEQAHTGPGGIYDRLEQDMGHGPLRWDVDLSARIPTDDEARVLVVPRGTPLLVLTRLTHSGTTSEPVEVNTTAVSAARFKISQRVTRARSARWPVRPAQAENSPQPEPEHDSL